MFSIGSNYKGLPRNYREPTDMMVLVVEGRSCSKPFLDRLTRRMWYNGLWALFKGVGPLFYVLSWSRHWYGLIVRGIEYRFLPNWTQRPQQRFLELRGIQKDVSSGADFW